MKVAISVPDRTFAAAERVAKRLGISRSSLYVQAIEHFVKTHQSVEVRETLTAVYGRTIAAVDPVIDRLQGEALREEW
jgi:predicted transcriptional regulator